MAIQANQVVMLTGDDAGLHNLIARVRNNHIKRDFQRRDAVIIKNLDTGTKIIRYVLGESQNLALERGTVAVDYDGLVSLGYKFSDAAQPCNLEVRKAGAFEKYLFFMNHPDLGIQLSIRLGILGVGLGLIGLFLGVGSMAL